MYWRQAVTTATLPRRRYAIPALASRIDLWLAPLLPLQFPSGISCFLSAPVARPQLGKRGQAMLGSTRTVVLFGIAVQIAAFMRTAIIAATLGASLDVDAYNLGLIAPSFISTVIGSWLQLSFIGRYTSLVTTGETRLAAAYRGRMLLLMFGLALAFAGLCFLLPGHIMAPFLPNGQPAMVAAATAALKLSGLILVPIILGDFIAL